MLQGLTQLENDGFTILKKVAKETDLEQARELTNSIINYADLNLEDPFDNYYLRHRSDQGVLYDLCQRHPEFERLSRLPAILDLLELVLGEDIFLYENSLVYKPPGRENAVPWHQDFISRPNEPTKYIAWLALDDVTENNGALKAIPASHKLGYLPWHRVKGETHHDRLDLKNVDTSTAHFLEVEAGDALIFNAKLVHGSEECHSEKQRRAYRVSYQGFQQLYSPRGTPLVVRGGRPESLSKKFPKPKIQKPNWKIFLNRIGKRLQKL